jgi:hypothetical protein
LRGQLREMTAQLAWAEPQDAGRASETRTEAASLRSDIQEAQAHIDRLQRRYLGSTSSAGAVSHG